MFSGVALVKDASLWRSHEFPDEFLGTLNDEIFIESNWMAVLEFEMIYGVYVYLKNLPRAQWRPSSALNAFARIKYLDR